MELEAAFLAKEHRSPRFCTIFKIGWFKKPNWCGGAEIKTTAQSKTYSVAEGYTIGHPISEIV